MEPSPSQQQVHALFGRCLLRLQQFEVQMKRMLATHSVSSNASGFVPIDAKWAKDLPTSTLGLLAREFFRLVVVVAGTSQDVPGMNRVPREITFTTTARIELSGEDHESAEQWVADLVELRNTLVHHFIDLFDLWSEPGCNQAIEYLTTACDRIGRDLERLQAWAKSMDEARQSAVAFLQSQAGADRLDNGIAVDGTVNWERAGIVACLREAAAAIKVDGWTPLSAAVAFVTERSRRRRSMGVDPGHRSLISRGASSSRTPSSRGLTRLRFFESARRAKN